MNKIGELRAISSHVLGASKVQIPRNNLDNLYSIREEENGETEVLDPRDILGSILLAFRDFTILGLLLEPIVLDILQSTREEEDRATEVSNPRDVSGSILLAVIDFATLGATTSRGMGTGRGTLLVSIILVKGHGFPTKVKVLPVGFHFIQQS
nr:hypothetical protein [Tanacetum cinerariifolium]